MCWRVDRQKRASVCACLSFSLCLPEPPGPKCMHGCAGAGRAWIAAQGKKVITGKWQKSNKVDLAFIRRTYFESSDVLLSLGQVSELCLCKGVFVSPGCTGLLRGPGAGRASGGCWPHNPGHMRRGLDIWAGVWAGE